MTTERGSDPARPALVLCYMLGAGAGRGSYSPQLPVLERGPSGWAGAEHCHTARGRH